MAGVSVLSAEVLLSKRVQEMVLNGEEPPAPYISRDDDPSDDDDSTVSPIPIIDLSVLSHSTASTEEYEEELQKLKSALHTWGCFQAVNHGISSSFIDEILQVTREFFEQPMEEKKKYSKTVVEVDGYGADPVPEEGQSLDWSDRLFLDVYPEDLRKPKFWPENPSSFGEVLREYTEKTKMVIEVISKAMAKSLNLEENCFLNQFGERATIQARFNYYSKCQRPDLILGLKPHADGSGYTSILPDEVGLQVFNNDRWHTVPKISHAILILMGDQMEIMTNGVFKSPVHRVLSNSERDRISVAMFYTPEKGKEIGPEDGLVDDERPRLFKKVKDYAGIHWDYYQRGLRALHTAQA
ncbi:protein SRG1-like isoform X2 [Actinidia eriantha]|uniref:protein SRG1-like isoform X2 n=1 Tax=Actinidia eriantha TaxID=165200 RepID=UPI00258FEF9C|nr:protein SRG1-like isoform X2 [Actinidia eriantha]